MNQIISADAVKNSGLSFDNLKSYASATGLLAAGMLVAHAGLKLVKMQESVLANAGVSVAAFVGAMMLGNPWVKLGCLGVSVYAGLNAISLGARELTKPANTGAGGLSGFIPEKLKPSIRSWVPSFGTLASYDEINGLGDPDDMGEINLDDPIHGLDEERNLSNVEESVSGLGEAAVSMM